MYHFNSEREIGRSRTSVIAVLCLLKSVRSCPDLLCSELSESAHPAAMLIHSNCQIADIQQ